MSLRTLPALNARCRLFSCCLSQRIALTPYFVLSADTRRVSDRMGVHQPRRVHLRWLFGDSPQVCWSRVRYRVRVVHIPAHVQWPKNRCKTRGDALRRLRRCSPARRSRHRRRALTVMLLPLNSSPKASSVVEAQSGSWLMRPASFKSLFR